MGDFGEQLIPTGMDDGNLFLVAYAWSHALKRVLVNYLAHVSLPRSTDIDLQAPRFRHTSADKGLLANTWSLHRQTLLSLLTVVPFTDFERTRVIGSIECNTLLCRVLLRDSSHLIASPVQSLFSIVCGTVQVINTTFFPLAFHLYLLFWSSSLVVLSFTCLSAWAQRSVKTIRCIKN